MSVGSTTCKKVGCDPRAHSDTVVQPSREDVNRLYRAMSESRLLFITRIIPGRCRRSIATDRTVRDLRRAGVYQAVTSGQAETSADSNPIPVAVRNRLAHKAVGQDSDPA